MPNPRRLTHSRGTSWEITYRLDGRMVRQRFESRSLAVTALARARAQALDGLGIALADGKTTLAEYAPRWLAAQQCRPSTLAMYDSHVRNHIVPMLGRRPMAALRRSDISARPVPGARRALTDLLPPAAPSPPGSLSTDRCATSRTASAPRYASRSRDSGGRGAVSTECGRRSTSRGASYASSTSTTIEMPTAPDGERS